MRGRSMTSWSGAAMVTVVVLSPGVGAGAQEPVEGPPAEWSLRGEPEVVYEFRGEPLLGAAQLPDVAFFDVVAGFGGEVVTGAPYSAETETEFVQTLADGNRIVRRNTATVHRDGQGRTRRELGVALVGPLAAGDEESPRHVVIDDPVADVSWVLDPQTRTARRQPRLAVEWTARGDRTAAGGAGSAAAVWAGKLEGRRAAGVDHVRVKVPGGSSLPHRDRFVAEWSSGAEAREEPLGVRDVSGVAAQGERRVVTIPAGRIGNEQPIEIVTERWYSEELRTVVESLRRDPRVGETRFRLRDVRLGEPDPALFEVPDGWAREEGRAPERLIIHEREEQPGS